MELSGQYPLVDTHCHLYWPGLLEQIDEVIARARQVGIGAIIVPGINLETSVQAQELACRFAEVFFAAGLHPSEVHATPASAVGKLLARFLGHPKLVAIGEIGLDAHYDYRAVEGQRPAFRAQLRFAAEHNLPVIVHHRDAGRQVVEELSAFPQLTGVFHCYDGSRRLLKYSQEAGFLLSLAGNVTYASARNLHAQLPRIPEDRLLVETDAPWMPPEPVRKAKVGEPSHLTHTLGFLASRLAKSPDSLRMLLSRNSYGLFHPLGDTDGA